MSDSRPRSEDPASPASPGDATPGTTAASPSSKNFSRTPTSWDAEDDILLMHLKDSQKLGWKEIASHFNNRTPNACQFRWRRLKSGNLKNPPKSASALGTQINSKPSPSGAVKKPKKAPASAFKSESGTLAPPAPTTGFPAAYSPISNATFTGYDNNVSNALAGLNALSNTPSNILSPLPNYNTNPSTPGLNSPGVGANGAASHLNHSTYDDSPKSDVILDPQAHNNAATNTGGGYYADISIDPTMNLPHNQPHPHTPHGITPRNSTSHGSSSTQTTSSNAPSSSQHPNLHNNSIIQIVRDDRASISLSRASVSSLPSKSMNIPHHQLNNNALAHLPILFGSGSVSGPSRNPSISGPGGIQHSTTVSSLRNGSAGGSGPGYYSRSGSVVIPYNAEKKDEEPLKFDKKKTESKTIHKNKPSASSGASASKNPNSPVFKIPWSMDEDELLINRRNRELSFAELSILLPQRTEGEIWSRIDYLEKLRNGHRASTSRDHRRRRQSSIGLDDVDDFYDDVDDVIGGIDVSEDEDEDDEDEEVLVDVDDSMPRKRRKRRASSAVNPLAVGDSIRKKLR
ncbi:uncharacterized protein CANTADRAFT_5561 [Suhomyces tanzawaensis NRRL Y-17324]|uniref:Myb-like domain-containing protein n=1 Tax=Suhomyces tanzawaensis NRRL Y-17324 TaxID=984487 RepID=A0A1E4SK40_9ASCO|nr:uncharacterized protein CANTADRAFT_5561 [Suhomyces tanzawaensis NRRL Y-17324]ODV79860.1 hypothetical protein CANTADRAFT_5561 [Suhomyces tanzawaensis NRRL Y-17324]